MNDKLLVLWGKTCRDPKEPEADLIYHPLLFHLLDVGHCTLELWDTFLSDGWKKRIAETLACDETTARWAMAFLAGAHDLGKATPGFQFQKTPLDWLRERLHSAGFMAPANPENKPHNFVSSKELHHFWMQNLWRWQAQNRRVAPVLAHITGAHHGTFPNAGDYSKWNDDVLGSPIWREARLALLDALAAHLCPPDFAFPPTLKWDDAGAIPVLAGLISVADWIGSSSHFRIEGHRDKLISVPDYLLKSRKRARTALDDFGFAATPRFVAPKPDFAEFWGFEPNPLQDAVIAQTQNAQAPFLLLCEAPMGSGKTESAFWAADAAFTGALNQGLYIALPTQATSNAMHARTRKFLEKRLPRGAIHLQLVHGNAGLLETPNVVFEPLSTLYEQLENDPEKARVMALSWFSGAKRPLLAPFGVGTIDQSLLGALQSRHWFVRLFGLAGKVVVFDEVHAYDTYMSRLLIVLLHWLRELGCSVILLSATLPSGKRRELVEAWGAALPDAEAKYPRLTWCDDKPNAVSIGIEGAEMAPKNVAVSVLKPENLAAELRRKLKNGGCAAIICNTVKEAQALFQILQSELGDFIKPKGLILFHARMPFKWRRRIESKVRRLFGKRKAMRPHRAIIVSTQLLEQSLDLDFDWMASFMAPSDLLLQRVGRLHRHPETPHRYDLTQPQLAILCDAEGDAPPNFGASEWVYEREVLLRSWLLWRGKTVLKLPGEIESLIENTYENAPHLPDEIWRKAIVDAQAHAENERSKAEGKAKNVVVKLRTERGNRRAPSELVEAPSLDLRDDDDPAIHAALRASTRDGDESVTVICLCLVGKSFYLPSPDGTPNLQSPVSLKQELAKNEAKKLMDFAVSLSQKGLYGELLQIEVPAAWKKSPFLRHARPLCFHNGAVAIGNFVLRLDGALGIVIEKEKSETGAE